MPTRLSRAEQVERNRGLVLDAARRGLPRARLRRGDAGRDRRGGRVLQGRGLLAVRRASPTCSSRCSRPGSIERAAENAGLAAAGTPDRRAARAAAQANARRSEDGGDWARLLIEFRVVAARDPELNRRYAALHGRTLDQFADAVRGVLARGGPRPGLPAAQFCRADLRPRRRLGARAGRGHRATRARRPRSTWSSSARRSPAESDRSDHTCSARGGPDAHHDHRTPALAARRVPRDLQRGAAGQLPEQIARTGWGRAQILAHQRRRLQLLLTHAAAHSPFHARRLAGIDLDAVDPGDLTALPVMTKAEMMAELDDVFTDRRLTPPTWKRRSPRPDRNPAVLLGSLPRPRLRRQLGATRRVRTGPPRRRRSSSAR